MHNMVEPCAVHHTVYTRGHARWYNVQHNILPSLRHHHSGPQASLGPMPNRAYLTLCASRTHPFRRVITMSTATGADLGHIHAELITHSVPRRLQTFSRDDTPRPACSRPPTVHVPSASASGRRIGGRVVRARAQEGPGLPLGRHPSQGPPRRVVPDEAATLRSKTSPAQRLQQPPK